MSKLTEALDVMETVGKTAEGSKSAGTHCYVPQLTGNYHEDCNIFIKEINRLRDAIKKHRDTFPDEVLIGEKLWESIDT